jgi:hypothetical protein
VRDNLVHKTFVQVFENLWSQGVPFDYHGLGILHVHCDFGVPHGHCGFVFLSPWSCDFHGCHGFVFIMIAVVLMFFSIIMVSCFSWSLWYCILHNHNGLGVSFNHHGLLFLLNHCGLMFLLFGGYK